MNATNPSVPSLKALIFATVFALLLATVILISTVLPAEYGIDPTGLGKKMGLTALSAQSEASTQPFVFSCPVLPSRVAGSTETSQWQDSVIIKVPAGKGLEYKFHLAKGENLAYSWETDGAELYFDFHGEPQGDRTGYFKSFKESTDNQSSGALTAPFEGSHGWYWENKTRSSVIVVLKTKGSYQVLGLM